MTDREQVFEYSLYTNENYDLSIFDELLERDISEDTKALITAQREIYKQNEDFSELYYNRMQQVIMGLDQTLRFHENSQKVNNDNALNLIGAVQNLNLEGGSGHDYTSILDRLESSTNALSNKLDIVGDNTQIVADSVPLSNYADSYIVAGTTLFFGGVVVYFISRFLWNLVLRIF